MDKYIGTYRVEIERDLVTGDHIPGGFTYLRCVGRNKGGKVYRYDEDTLVCYMQGTGKINNTIEEMNKMGLYNKVEWYYSEADIHFKECDLDKLEELLGLTKFGASILPTSIRNHPRRDEIRQERLGNMSDEERERRRILGKQLAERFKR